MSRQSKKTPLLLIAGILCLGTLAVLVRLFLTDVVDNRRPPRSLSEKHDFLPRDNAAERDDPPSPGDRPRDRQIVTVRVMDETGSPVPGATVALLVDPLGEHGGQVRKDRRVAFSDPEGRAMLAWPTSAQAAHIVARHPEHTHARASLSSVPTAPVDLVLGKGLSLEGEVVTAVGNKGVMHVRVVARSVGAGVRSGNAEFVAGIDAEVQTSTTDQAGRFVLRGLRPGWYQVEVSVPGMVTVANGLRPPAGGTRRRFGRIPPGRWGHDRAVVVQAGSKEFIRIQVLAAGIVALRTLDAESSTPIAESDVRTRAPEGFEDWPGGLGDSAVFVANGRTIDLTGQYEPIGVHRFAVVSENWPIPADAKVQVRVSAAGYAEAEFDVSVVPAGSDVVPEDVTLERQSPRGSVRLRLVDQAGAPVGPAAFPVVATQESRTWTIRVVVDDTGVSELLSFPVGRVALGGARNLHSSPGIEPTSVDVAVLEPASATLRLHGGALMVESVDQAGRVLDDVGIRMGPGHEPVRVQWWRGPSGGQLSTGHFMRKPGQGSRERTVITGIGPGAWTIEGYRHGYQPARLSLNIKPGVVTHAKLVLREDATTEWATWEQVVAGLPDGELPSMAEALGEGQKGGG